LLSRQIEFAHRLLDGRSFFGSIDDAEQLGFGGGAVAFAI
jgi:hypothetical protein